MGVHGLWKLIEPTGKPVTLESLDNKILAIDVSMWLHQVMKGYQDSTGNALPNAHLLGLFHRICKLLFYRIRPVFVFDGGVPQLKQQTMASRRQHRSKAARQAERNRLILLRNLAEQGIVRQALGVTSRTTGSTTTNKPSAFADFILDPLPTLDETSEESEVDEDDHHQRSYINFDNFDPENDEFKRLPAKERLEILTDLQETRKQNSWARINEMPQESGEFSGFQLRRLLVRRSAQLGLEQAEKELGERHTLTVAQLEELMVERGSLSDALANMSQDAGSRIVSDNVTRYLLLKNGELDQRLDDTSLNTVSNSTIKTYNKRETSTEVDLITEIDEEDIVVSQGDDEPELTQAEIFATITTSNIKSPPPIPFDINLPSTSSGGFFKSISSDKTETSFLALPNEKISNSGEHEMRLSEDLVKCIAAIKVPVKHKMNTANIATTERTNGADDISITIREGINNSAIKVSKAKLDTKCDASIICSNRILEIDTVDIKESVSHSKTSSSIENKSPKNVHNYEHMGTQIMLPELSLKSKETIIENKIIESVSPVSHTNEPSEESSDSEVSLEEVPEVIESGLKTNLEIKLNARKLENAPEDDIFADVFKECHKGEQVLGTKLEIKINANELVGVPKDDIFVDVFEECSKEEQMLEIIDDSEESMELQDEQTSKSSVLEPAETSIVQKVSNKELVQLEASLVNEGRQLASEVGRQERLAASISDQMCLEAQQLLQLFGLPWIVAPMEAEAQCAMLDLLSLTQGTVTDDSDIWLFGGRTVYRNFFNQNKTIEMYTSDAIQRCFKLSRGQLILLAMLVGSDYTCGLAGIGPVTALEILSTFSSSAVIQQPDELVRPLQKFKDWWEQREQSSTSSNLKRLSKKLRDLNIHIGFPNEAVAEAYLHPSVDDSRELFSWGKPNLPALVSFAKEKFGWSQQRCESILSPVLKRLEDTSIQKKLDDYFTVGPQKSKMEERLSVRVRDAVRQFNSNSDEEDDNLCPTVEPKAQKSVSKNFSRQKTVPKRQLSTLETMRKALNKKPRKKAMKNDILPLAKLRVNPSTSKTPEESIPQREKDKEHALQSRMKAIELFRKRKLDPTPRNKKTKILTKDDHYLSESSSDD